MKRMICSLAMSLVVWASFALAQEGKPNTEKLPAADFTSDNMFLAWIKLSENFEYSDRRDDAYMQIAMQETWNRVRNNEFMLMKARGDARMRLQKLVAGFNAEQEFVLKHAQVSLSTYDFANEVFPVEGMSDSHYWYTKASRYVEHLPGTFSVYFLNTKPVSKINMDKNTAEAFIKDRTDRFGNVNRSAVAEIRFQLNKVKDHRAAEFYATIRSVTYFTDAKKGKVIAHMALPVEPAEEP